MMLRIAATTLGIAALASQAAMTKVDDGFSSDYIVGQGPADPISKATIGEDAIYWVKVDNIEPARTYGVRCLVTNGSGETVSDEQSDEATRATHGYLHCRYGAEAADTYHFAVVVDGREFSTGQIEAERRILGLKKNVFLATFIGIPLVVLVIAWQRRKKAEA